MSEEGEIRMCDMCNGGEALPGGLVPICQKCYDEMNWGVFDSPWPWALRIRDEFRTEYRSMLKDFEDKGNSRQMALEYLRQKESGDEYFGSVARSEEDEYQQGLPEDERHDNSLKRKHSVDSDTSEQAGPSARQRQQQLTEDNLGQYLDQLNNEASQRLRRAVRAAARQQYRQILHDQVWNRGHNRQQALDHLHDNYRTYTPFFASVAASEAAEFQGRETLKQDYRRMLHRKGPENRDATLAWLRDKWSSRVRFQSVADSEEASYQDQNSSEEDDDEDDESDMDGDS